MKLRITVQNQTYDVDVEVLDAAPGSGTLNHTSPASVAPRSAAPAIGATSPATSVAPVARAAPPGSGGGDVPSPIAGTVLDVKVKAGDFA